MARSGRNAADERILMALSCGATHAKAAQEAGTSERTVRRKMSDPTFRARLHQLRGEALERAGGMLTVASMKAVSTLLTLQDATQPPAVRLGAAKAVLELSMRVREMNELEQRLAALETQIEAQIASQGHH